MTKMPKTIYAKWAEEGTKNQYLIVDESPDNLVERGEKKKVAVYELVGYTEVTNKTTISEVARVKGKQR